ncbi:hypothetical protein LR48_Vigan293s000200 [Vigna angularis]|uniref:Uncharacterized protein n=1 Tax=Phaseolus angularis TaxID=3914 RepID=A0A0L9T881_PHAAN|nr:hypothetical protein LR48_Vigan293s000200 [Vigna angularis]
MTRGSSSPLLLFLDDVAMAVKARDGAAREQQRCCDGGCNGGESAATVDGEMDSVCGLDSPLELGVLLLSFLCGF